MRLARFILLILIAVFVAQIVYYYPPLPETVATHFNAAGTADGFMSKTGFVIFEIALLLLIVGEFTLLPRLIEKLPASLLNIPNKEYWLAPERRAETFLTIRNYFEWFSVLLLILFTVVNQQVFRANLTKENLSPFQMWLIIALFLAGVSFWLVKLLRHFHKTQDVERP